MYHTIYDYHTFFKKYVIHFFMASYLVHFVYSLFDGISNLQTFGSSNL